MNKNRPSSGGSSKPSGGSKSSGGLTLSAKKPSGLDRFKTDKKSQKSKGGFGLYWLPLGGRGGKHKKNKYYVSHGDEESPERSIMSGDSPNVHKEAFDFKEKEHHQPGRTSPLPTTSKEAGLQSSSQSATQGTGPVQASVLVDHSKDDDDKDLFGSPTLNNSDISSKKDDNDQTLALEEFEASKGRDKKDKANGRKKENGHFDKVDGVYMSNGVKKEQEEEEDLDNCIVKCLYVTMTCCECTIM